MNIPTLIALTLLCYAPIINAADAVTTNLATGTNAAQRIDQSTAGTKGIDTLTIIVLSIGYVLYVVQAFIANAEAKRTTVPYPPVGNINLRSLVFGRTDVAFETWVFVFLSFVLATGLPTIFHIVEMQRKAQDLIPLRLAYELATQILFVLILLEFSYLFELVFKRNRYVKWTGLIVVALGIDVAMWLFLMLSGNPAERPNAVASSMTVSFLFLTSFIAFCSSALIIVFVRKLP